MKVSRVVIIGGGISGLSAAYALSGAGRPIDVTILEKAPKLGGKLRTHFVDGMQLDAGAESVLARRPEAMALIRDVGLGADLRYPATSGAGVWVEGSLRPLPKRQLLGIPYSAEDAASSDVLDESAIACLRTEPALSAPPDADVSVGSLVRAQLGAQVVERLVEPLLGGVYAGQADEISLDMAVPGLLDRLQTQTSLMTAVQAMSSDRSSAEPLFASIEGGLGRLPAVVAIASGATIRCATEATDIQRNGRGWAIRVWSAGSESVVDADAVLMACDGPSAGALLQQVSTDASEILAGISYASVALVTFVFEASTRVGWPGGTGFLVPPSEGLATKAATFVSQKWAWVNDAYPNSVVVRASVGRFGELDQLNCSNQELAKLVHEELQQISGVFDKPRSSVVTRWDRSLPQYCVGHRGRVESVRRSLAGGGGIDICGAAVDGVGIPACIASARAAATRVIDFLVETGQWDRDH